MARRIEYMLSQAYNLGYDDGYKDGYEEGKMVGSLDNQVVDADGKPVVAETLKNACEIVRNTTKQKVIDKACETYCKVCYNKTTDCKEFCNDVNIFRNAMKELYD